MSSPSLTPQAPLSQVVFVHDYLQLVFDDERFSIFNPCLLSVAGRDVRAGTMGFCDSLVALIGQTATRSSTSELLLLCFSGGATLTVLRSNSGSVEAFTFHGEHNLVVVERNA
jgi:hypothetical protein